MKVQVDAMIAPLFRDMKLLWLLSLSGLYGRSWASLFGLFGQSLSEEWLSELNHGSLARCRLLEWSRTSPSVLIG